MVGEAVKKREARWWRWLPVGAFAAYGFWSQHLWVGVFWTLMLALGLISNVHQMKALWRRPVLAYALNWLVPALVACISLQRVERHDYWGVAFFTVILGFAVVNAMYLEPSPRRTMLYRILLGMLVLVSVASVYAYMTGPY